MLIGVGSVLATACGNLAQCKYKALRVTARISPMSTARIFKNMRQNEIIQTARISGRSNRHGIGPGDNFFFIVTWIRSVPMKLHACSPPPPRPGLVAVVRFPTGEVEVASRWQCEKQFADEFYLFEMGVFPFVRVFSRYSSILLGGCVSHRYISR